MRRVLLVAFLAVVGLLGARTRLDATGGKPTVSTHMDRERVRLRAHFDSVLSELAVVDVSALRPAQRDARATLIRWLADYREAGAFPLNDLGTHDETPIFRDSRGVLCAMAYLIDRSGRGDLVDEVAHSRNTAYIIELADDARLVAWLDSTGLSEAEAARIQPTYPRSPYLIERDYVVHGMILSGLSAVSATANLLAPGPVRGWLGLAIGGATVATGARRTYYKAAWGRYDSPNVVEVRERKDDVVKKVILTSGSLAVLGGIYALTRPERPRDTGRNALETMVSHVLLGSSVHPASGSVQLTVGFNSLF